MKRFEIKFVDNATLAMTQDIPEAACTEGSTCIVYREESVWKAIAVRLKAVGGEANVVVTERTFESREDEKRARPNGLGMAPTVCQTIIARRLKLQNGTLVPA